MTDRNLEAYLKRHSIPMSPEAQRELLIDVFVLREHERELLTHVQKMQDLALKYERVLQGVFIDLHFHEQPDEDGYIIPGDQVALAIKGFILTFAPEIGKIIQHIYGVPRSPLTPKQRFAVLQRDGFRCVYCGQSPEDGIVLEVDHAQPRALGGADDDENYVAACQSCNRGKGTSLVERSSR